MAGRQNAQGSRSRFGRWLLAACVSLCWAATNLEAQSRSITPPPAVAQAPATCVAPAATAQRPTPGRVTVSSAGDVAGKPNAKPNAKTHQWTVQVASFESLQDAQSMRQSLCDHGFEARVLGVARPYVVRVGRFSTSQDALVAARRLTTPKLTVFVTQAER
jgi:cell division protein FtsN